MGGFNVLCPSARMFAKNLEKELEPGSIVQLRLLLESHVVFVGNVMKNKDFCFSERAKIKARSEEALFLALKALGDKYCIGETPQ